MKTLLRNIALAATLVGSATAAAQGPAPVPGAGAPVLGVTHEHQGGTSWCNFYALAAITRFHNEQNPANPHTPVLDQVMPPGVMGPPRPGLVSLARGRGWHSGRTNEALQDRDFIRLANGMGYTTVNYSGTFGTDSPAARQRAMTQLLAELAAGNPPGIGLNGHAWVVVGVRRNARGEPTQVLLTHSGPPGATAEAMDYDDFIRDWARGAEGQAFNMIAVRPPNRPVARAGGGAGPVGRIGGASPAGMRR